MSVPERFRTVGGYDVHTSCTGELFGRGVSIVAAVIMAYIAHASQPAEKEASSRFILQICQI